MGSFNAAVVRTLRTHTGYGDTVLEDAKFKIIEPSGTDPDGTLRIEIWRREGTHVELRLNQVWHVQAKDLLIELVAELTDDMYIRGEFRTETTAGAEVEAVSGTAAWKFEVGQVVCHVMDRGMVDLFMPPAESTPVE